MAVFGIQDNDVSEALKVTIVQAGGDKVVGYIGEGASKSLTVDWNTPLGAESSQSQTVALLKNATSMTAKNKLSTTLIWDSVQPFAFNLPIYFSAFSDAKREVHDAIIALEEMASPELSKTVGFGSTPKTVSINIGRKILIKEAVIEEVSSELDQPVDSNGFMVRNTVNLTIKPISATNKQDIRKQIYRG